MDRRIPIPPIPTQSVPILKFKSYSHGIPIRLFPLQRTHNSDFRLNYGLASKTELDRQTLNIPILWRKVV